MGKDSDGDWIEVEDNGIGMPMSVLQGPLLDFGKSFWDSDLMLKELPGLSAKGFQSIGKFGIGFYSVFMVGDKAKIITRKYDAAQRDTLVLEFKKGVISRPILRNAEDSKVIIEGGTRVRVWLSVPPYDKNGIFSRKRESASIKDICAWLCPCIDVDLFVDEAGLNKIIEASDWLKLDNNIFLKRIFIDWRIDYEDYIDETFIELYLFSNNLSLLRDSSGKIAGRVVIIPDFLPFGGAVTIGGLRSSELRGIQGTLVGIPTTATRNIAKPIVGYNELAAWATDQGEKILNCDINKSLLAGIAGTILSCGGDITNFPIAYCSQGWLNAAEVSKLMAQFDEILLPRYHSLYLLKEYIGFLELNDNVIFIQEHTEMVHSELYNWPNFEEEPFGKYDRQLKSSLLGALITELSKCWMVSPEEIIEASTIRGKRTEMESREIGMSSEKPILDKVHIIKNINKKG